MNILIPIGLGLIPGIFWLWLFYYKCRVAPAPKSVLVRLFVWGILLAIPVVLLQMPFFYLLKSHLFLFTVVAPLTEEYGKYFIVRRSLYRRADFTEPMQGMMYAVTVSLGFASIENIFYLLATYLERHDFTGLAGQLNRYEILLFVFAVRALLSVPAHALWAGLWGYPLGVAKFSAQEVGKKWVRNGLIVAIIGHGLFNWMLVFAPGAAVVLLLLIGWGWRRISRRMQGAIARRTEGDR